jgi:selenocysteine-specific elongation factor
MNNIIIGTSGHVDHGKTKLIEALTGIDTDRLSEEKQRGITIDLGFANLENDRNLDIGIIDVPGHEKFIKNMLAGIGGIDVVLLVVAADEGVMPQTKEHFNIVKGLGIKTGIIVITKADMADEETIELVKLEILDLVSGSFLEDAEVITTSVINGENIQLLKDKLIDLAYRVNKDELNEKSFRMPIDRVFTIKGFGTVVTGTAISGEISLKDDLTIYPSLLSCKVRGLQVHGNEESTAYRGQRIAVNISNVDRDKINRGDVIAEKNSLKNSMLLDVKIGLFDDTKRKLKNNDRVHLYIGAKELLAKVVLFKAESISRGEYTYAQFRLEEEIAVKRDDRFIIRFYSPLETFGFGTVLNENPKKLKRLKEYNGEYFQLLDGNYNDYICAIVKYGKNRYPKSDIRDDRIINLSNGFAIDRDRYKGYEEFSTSILIDFYDRKKTEPGMKKDEFLNKIDDNREFALALLENFIEKGLFKNSNGLICLKNHKIQLSNKELDTIALLNNIFNNQGFQITNIKQLDIPDNSTNLLKYMVNTGELILLDENYYISKDRFDEAKELFKNQKEGISLGEFRDKLNTSRKSALLLLEYMDSKGITYKSGELRYINM